MLKKRIIRIAFVLACIVVLLMPYTTTVLAAALTKNDTKADLQVLVVHEGGEEASGTLTDKQREFYDESPYGYRVGETRVFKIIVKGDTNYENMFYCLNANKSFPGVTATGYNSLEYTNVADFKDSTDSNVKALHLSTSYSDDSAKWTANYKALIWLVNNMFLKKQAPEQKDDYLAKAFADYEDHDLDTVKAFLTDDDIDVVQQYAMWYFTNNDTEKFNVETLPSVTVSKFEMNDDMEPVETTGSYYDVTGYSYRQDMADHLYKYLIKSAIEGKDTPSVTYPVMENITPVATGNDNYYVVGPFKVKSGTAAPTEYNISLVDQNKKEISRDAYDILIDGEEEFTNKNINEIFDSEYYIYLPKTNTNITKISLGLSYSSYETSATLWENKSVNDEGIEVYQPLVLLTKDETPYIQNKEVEINADLALRKYIIKVNDTSVNRKPDVDVSGLKNGTSRTAEYKHAKDPVKVAVGDTVVYEIRVYNEGDIDANGTIIADSLPAGLEYVEDSEINRTYGWEKALDGTNRTVYKTNYLENTTIEKFDKNSDELNSAYVQIECKIGSNAKAASILTNVAEISADGILDRDSNPDNNDYIKNDYDSSNYKGNNSNKEDLTDKNYHYKGREDDDDFEKVEVEGRAFDLSLKKFISKINNSAPKTSREPVVDVTSLKNGSSTDAKYTTVKTPLVVEKGDIVTYTIRVYNEGDIEGYAEEVADYLPEGLGFLVGHTTNVDNYWKIPEDSKTVKLSTISNGTKNLSKDDFKGVDKLSDVDVVVGKAKLTSTKLKSSETDTKNLIQAFDKQNGTKLDFKDIQVTCIVLADKVSNNNFRNIAEITKDSDDDIDSTPDTVNPDNYPGDDEKQDDNDYENLTTEDKEFDLSLQKFITKVNDGEITGREPSVTKDSNGKLKITSNAEALPVENNDLVTYTIRVYNEGNIAGYAKEVSDDIPNGLEFVKDNETNKKYDWKLYDKDGKVTTDLKQAVTVKTDYLSKEKSQARNEDCLIKAFDPSKDAKDVDYKDLQIVFKIVETDAKKNEGRIIINTAEITDDSDENGNPIEDIDSTPGNNKDGEDDIDTEKVYVKYFDLALQKDLIKIIVSENGTTREISVNSADGLQKVEIHRKKVKSTVVKFVYNITVKNEGQIAGYATEVKDYIPDGLEFIAEENKQWTKVSDKEITTNALAKTRLEPGQTASVQVTLKWINGEDNLGLKTNVAEISADKNDSNTPDIDSTPNNKVMTEDDIDTAEVMLEISTGKAPTYLALTTTVLMILTTGIILIKKYVLI